MNNELLKSFINRYSGYYFDDINNEDKKYGREKLGLSINHPTSRNTEEEIIGFLKSGKQSIETIAWKTGGKIESGKLKTQYHKYDIKTLELFCDKTNMNKQLSFDNNDSIRMSYDYILKIMEDIKLDGYGSVYTISSLFFLSKGRVPIYDYYAHVAVKALLYDINPQEIFVGDAPEKKKHARADENKKLAMNMLFEYMEQLRCLANGTDYYLQDMMYISRELDQALWVYGHASEIWNKK